MRVVDYAARDGLAHVEPGPLRLALAIALLVALASPATAATPIYGNAYDTGMPGKVAGPGVFPGGYGNVTFRATGTSVPSLNVNGAIVHPSVSAALPGAGNRAVLDFDSSASGGNAYGVILLPSSCVGGSNAGNGCTVASECPSGSCVQQTASELTAGVYTTPILGPTAKCVGGARAGQLCLPGGTQTWHKCGTGVCVPQRVPYLSLATASAEGCSIFLSQSCSNTTVDSVCESPTEQLIGIYGDPFTTGGRCGASKTMTDTICGGACTTVADCLPGRPDADANDPQKSKPTACVNDVDGVTTCSTGACHCINECDEERPNEASCAPKYFGNVTLTQGQHYALGVRQKNETDPGKVTCAFLGGSFGSLCLAGSNAGAKCSTGSECPGSSCVANQPVVFQRGPAEPTKVGVCAVGALGHATFSKLENGGKLGLACGSDADCTCNTSWPTYGSLGTCQASSCSTAARITPDRVIEGWNDGTSPKARALMDATLIQTGSSPTVTYRPETSIALGNGSVTGWDPQGGSCTNVATCLAAGTGGASEPDGNGTRLQNTQTLTSTWTHEWTFVDVTEGSTWSAPLLVAMNVSAQDTQGSAGDAIGLRLSVFDGGGAAVGATYDLANFDFDDGASGSGGDGTNYWPPPPVIVTSQLGTLSAPEVNGFSGRALKVDLYGANKEGRISFTDRETFWPTTVPLVTNVLPGAKTVAAIGDSTCNDPPFFLALVGNNPEIVTLYDQCAGGAAMGDVIRAAPTLYAGGSTTRIPTTVVVGAPNQTVDVALVDIGANTIRMASNAPPSNPTAYGGLGQIGFCEDWTLGVGYGPNQGKPCHCNENNDWDTTDFVGQLCLLKNSSFGPIPLFGTCNCSSAADGQVDCELGGAAPPGSITQETCSGTAPGSTCVTPGSGLSMTSAASTRASWRAPGCVTSTCPACVSSNSVARLLAGKRELDRIAALTGTDNIWVTTPPPNGAEDLTDGWWETRPTIDLWRPVLLAEQKAIGGNWIDLYQYFVDSCGPNYLERGGINPCNRDSVHQSLVPPFGNELRANLSNACLSNTTLAGVAGKTTDGVCTVAAASTCSSGKCASGLRIGLACGSDAECNYCSGPSPGKLGINCQGATEQERNEVCGYYRCVHS